MRTYNTKGKSIVAVVAGAALAIGVLYAASSISFSFYTIVYSGRVDDYKVDYAEGNGYSKLTVTKDGVTVELKDEEGSTSLAWNQDKKPPFEKDTLEKIVVTDSKKTRSYAVSEKSDATLDGKHTKQVFVQGNALYTSLRTRIREELRNDYLADAQHVEELLK